MSRRCPLIWLPYSGVKQIGTGECSKERVNRASIQEKSRNKEKITRKFGNKHERAVTRTNLLIYFYFYFFFLPCYHSMNVIHHS